MRVALLFVLLAAPALAGEPTVRRPSGATDGQVIPVEFVGEWTADLSACGTDLSDSRLRIHNDFVEFYESRGIVTAVKRLKPGSIELTLSMSGEGELWETKTALKLINEGSVLLTRVDDGDEFARQRCPAR